MLLTKLHNHARSFVSNRRAVVGRSAVGRRRAALSQAGYSAGHSVVQRLEPRSLFAVTALQTLPNVSATSGAFATAIDLDTFFDSTTISGTTVGLDVAFGVGTNAVSTTINIELFDQQTPLTTANFLRYVDSGRYNGTFFHRLAKDFVVQGGGFDYASGGTAITKFGTVNNEFATSPRDANGKVNTRGTLAMAKKGNDPNSADSEFFFNTVDNSSNLDNQNGGFTTFAKVLGTGLNTIDQINNLPAVNLSGSQASDSNTSPFQSVPLADNPTGNNLVEANFVLVRTARRVNPITYTVTSSDLTLVNPVVSADGVLSLNYQPVRIGDATITVNAVDLDGATLSRSFSVSVTGAANLAVSFNNVRQDPTGTNALAFGSVQSPDGSAITRQLLIQNTGSVAITGLTYTAPSGYRILGTPITSLDSGQSSSLTLAIDAPPFGVKTGNLTIAATGSTLSNVVLALTATVRLPVTLGADGVKAVSFVSGTTTATFSLAGPGTAAFIFSGNGITPSEPRNGIVTITGTPILDIITLDQTTARSSLSLVTKGTGLITVPTVTSTGTASLAALNFKAAALTGSLTIGTGTATDASIRSITLASATNATIFVGRNNTAGLDVALTVDRVENSTISLGYAAKSVSVKTWIATGTALSATAVRSLSIGSNFAGSISMTGTLTTATVKGNLTAGTWQVNGDVAKLSAGGAGSSFVLDVGQFIRSATFAGDYSGYMQAISIVNFSAASGLNGPSIVAGGGFDSNGTQVAEGSIVKAAFKGNVVGGYLFAANTMGTISANSITETRIFAGANAPQNTDLPTTDTFESFSSIKSLTLTGRGVTNAFSASRIAARFIDKLNLGTVDAVAGLTNGVAAIGINTLTGRTDTGQSLNKKFLSSANPITITGTGVDFRIALIVASA